MPVITTRIQGSLPSARAEQVTLPIDITYCTKDPYALRFDFHTGDEEPVTWLLSAEVFEWVFDNYNRPLGDDASITFNHSGNITDDTVSIKLCSDKGEATVLIPAGELKPFITRVQGLATNDVKQQALDVMMQGVAALLAE